MVEQRSTVLLLMVGIPASGKSTLVQKLKYSADFSIEVVALDTVWQDIYSQMQLVQQDEKEKSIEAWHQAREVAFSQVHQMVTSQVKKLIIVDDTFEYASMRKVYYQLARDNKVAYLELFIHCPLETAIANNERRHAEQGTHHEVTEQTIHNVHARMQRSQFAPQYSIDLHYETEEIENLLIKINTQASVPPLILISARQIEELSQNERDRLDQHLRKHISELLKNQPCLRPYAKAMSNLKKQVLQGEIAAELENDCLESAIQAKFTELLNKQIK